MVLKNAINSALTPLDLVVRRKVEEPSAPIPLKLSRDEKDLFEYLERNRSAMGWSPRATCNPTAC